MQESKNLCASYLIKLLANFTGILYATEVYCLIKLILFLSDTINSQGRKVCTCVVLYNETLMLECIRSFTD